MNKPSCCEKCCVEDVHLDHGGLHSAVYCSNPACKCHKELCKTSPDCSHNTNGRDLDKPCSVSPTKPSGWELDWDNTIDRFLVTEPSKKVVKDFIRSLLRDKAEEIRGMKLTLEHPTLMDNNGMPCEVCETDYMFNQGIEKAASLLEN